MILVNNRLAIDTLVSDLLEHGRASLDTETTGLRPYHGDRLFSLILATDRTEYYLNFKQYETSITDYGTIPVLNREGVLTDLLTPLWLRCDFTWFMHNAKFDMAMLFHEGVEPRGRIHCTRSGARLERNDLTGYGLDDCAERIHSHKDDRVEKYIDEHHLWEWEQIPGKRTRVKKKFFDKVPFEIISTYACQDARVTYDLGVHQIKEIEKFSRMVGSANETNRTLLQVLDNECHLTKTVFEMEKVGVKIDRKYCGEALAYEEARTDTLTKEFTALTGSQFKSSGKLFQDVFKSEMSNWVWNPETRIPSFDSDVLARFSHPAAKLVLGLRDSKSRQDFYNGFLYYADRDDIIHPNFNTDGTKTGRFSSSSPNFQNLTSEEGDDSPYPVRRAIVPRPGYIFIMPDFDQMEYRMMFDEACVEVGYETAIVKEIKTGKDPHQATADLVTTRGVPLTRKRAKNGNFALLYGAGNKRLAQTVGGSVEDAKAIRAAILGVAPEIGVLIERLTTACERRGYIRNWYGRRIFVPRDLAYKTTNGYIQGGCADVNKVALNRIASGMAVGYKSRLVLSIHDENPCEVHESEIHTVPRLVKETMESVYPWKYLPLTVGMEWSAKSLGDKTKGFP